MRNAIALFVAALAISGCADRPPVGPDRQVARQLHDYIASHNSASFRSNDGVAYRMDNDVELTLYKDGSAERLDWGFAFETHRGTYSLRDDGVVLCFFQNVDADWPPMVASREGDAFVLRRWQGELPSTNPSAGPGAVIRAEPFWTFRQLSGDDEAAVLKAMRDNRDAK